MPAEIIQSGTRQRRRWYPEGAIKIREKNDLGVVYVLRQGERITLRGFRGDAGKPDFYETHRSEASAQKRVKSYFEGLARHHKAVAERRTAANAGHSFQVGDIITNSWGYDQTNVDWYRVVRVSRTFVWLETVAGQCEAQTGMMSGTATLHIDTSGDDPSKWGPMGSGKVTKHKASATSITMKYGCGTKWDGRPLHESWYA